MSEKFVLEYISDWYPASEFTVDEDLGKKMAEAVNDLGRWQIKERVGKYVISTVELSFDHSLGNGTPFWFETMVFRHEGPGRLDFNPRDIECKRYSKKVLAITGHRKMVAKYREMK